MGCPAVERGTGAVGRQVPAPQPLPLALAAAARPAPRGPNALRIRHPPPGWRPLRGCGDSGLVCGPWAVACTLMASFG